MIRALLAACLLFGGCMASAPPPPAHNPNRWIDIADAQQLCERLGGIDCAACVGRPAECYRAAYLVSKNRIVRADNPFVVDDDPFEDMTPYDNESIVREGMAVTAIGQVLDAVKP